MAGAAKVVALSLLASGSAAASGAPTKLEPAAVELSHLSSEASRVRGRSGDFIGASPGLRGVADVVRQTRCSVLGGLLSVEVSARCCFSVQVVMQRGLKAYGLAKGCEAAWSCEADGMTPQPAFENHALAQMCREEACVSNVAAAMRGSWMASKGADSFATACDEPTTVESGTVRGIMYAKMSGANNSKRVPEGVDTARLRQSTKAKANSTITDDPEKPSFKDQCIKEKCPDINKCDFEDPDCYRPKWYDFCVNKADRSDPCSRHCNCMVDGEESSSCFPGHALAVSESRGSVPVASLRVGEMVLVERPGGAFAFEPVLGFLHAITGRAGHLAVGHEKGVLRVSAGHIVFVRAAAGRADKAAAELEADDELITATGPGESSTASRVLWVRRETAFSGMYAPFTASGTIVVDGVVASNYATPSLRLRLPHWLAHACLAPVRVAHALGLPRLFFAVDQAQAEWKHPYLSLLHDQLRLDRLLLPAVGLSS